MSASLSHHHGPSEGHVLTDRARLYYRTVGEGRAIIVLHGGPDFDHYYLLPEMDRLAESFRLIYYDQRGRGRSAGAVKPDEVSIVSEIEDLDSVRGHFGLDAVALLGHSGGCVLAMEYATRHPDRVSHLRLAVLEECGHFAYLESPDAFYEHVAAPFESS